MNIKVGDKVITSSGRRGVVRDICNCLYCHERGYNEAIVTYDNGYMGDISIYQAESGFPDWYQIGDVTFPEHLDRNALLDRLAELHKEIDERQAEISDCQWMLSQSNE